MIKESQITELKEIVDKSVAELIKSMPKTIKDRTTGAVAALLGFENDSWGKWRVDHCNGRQSEISRWISEKAKKEMAAACDKIITKSVVREIIQSAKPVIEAEFREQFNRQLRLYVKEMAERHLKEEVQKCMDGLLGAMRSDLNSIAESAMSGHESLTQMAILESELESVENN